MATPTTLPATFVAGNVLTATQMNDLRGAFRILQVVNGTTTTSTTSSTNTYVDTTLTATITPSSTSSKILVLANQSGLLKQTNNTAILLRLMRGATEISKFSRALHTADNSTIANATASVCYLDSPATTSATTYKTQFQSTDNLAVITVQWDGAMSTITLLEVSA